jgi:nucleotide-binding universal stress UspA family protein
MPDSTRPTTLVGVDASACSGRALRWALDDAARRGAAVHVVLALRLGSGHRHGEAASVVDRERAAAERRLATVVAEAAAGVPGVPEPVTWQVVPTTGRPADVLVARSGDVDLLVVGRRGLGGLGRLALGSVSRRCAEAARCPVVVVPCGA